MQGTSRSAFPSRSLSACHSMAVKAKQEEPRESYVPAQAVKLGSYEAVEISPSKKKKRGRNEEKKETTVWTKFRPSMCALSLGAHETVVHLMPHCFCTGHRIPFSLTASSYFNYLFYAYALIPLFYYFL